MPIKNIYLRGGTTAQTSAYTGGDREITVDTTKKTLVVHDGSTAGGHPAALASAVLKKLSQLTGNDTLWTRSTLTKMSQLTDDTGYWKNLTKISQLTNDKNFKTEHCSYCTHCTYCSQCSKCNEVQCSNVQCTTYRCSDCTTVKCRYCYCDCDCNCDCDCGDDSD